MSDTNDTELITELETTREVLGQRVIHAKEVEALSRPPIVQELVLARRDMENARMRLGVALAMLKGHDPWSSKVKNKGNPVPPNAPAADPAAAQRGEPGSTNTGEDKPSPPA